MTQRIRQIQSNWANGVMSPRTLGRVDLDKYYQSAEIIRDMIVLPQGGVKRRPGSQYVADALGPSRLIPFVFAPGVAYILELGNQQMRIYYAYNDQAQSPGGNFQPPFTIGAQLPITLTTPFNTANISLWDIQYAQQGDVMYFVHPDYPAQKLIRYGTVGVVPSYTDTNWRLIQPNFKCPPIDQFNVIPTGGGTMTPSAVSGMGVTFTCSVGQFLSGDVGRYIFSSVDGGLALITGYISTTQVTCNIVDSFSSTGAIPFGSWFLQGSPSAWAAIGAPSGGNWNASKQFGVGAIDSVYAYTAYPSEGNPPPTAATIFRSSDIGMYLYISGCVVQITAVPSGAFCDVVYLSVPEQTFTGTVAGEIRVQPSAPGAWSFQQPAASITNGYFGSVAFFQDRLLLAGTPTQPKTVYGSVSGDYENFAKGTNAGDSLEFSIAGGKLDTIQWMAGTPVMGMLAIETDAGEYVVTGGGGGVGATGQGITPTNISVGPNSMQGGNQIPPILVDSALVYIQRYRTKVFEFSYNIYQSSFSSKDLSLFAEHLTHAGIKESAYQPLPYKIIWMVTADGRLLSMTYDKTQDVCAWAEHRTGYADNGYGAIGTGDSYLSVAVIPNPSTQLLNPNGTGAREYTGNVDPSYSSDLVWTVVQRTRNGAPSYCIEMMNEDLMVDSCTEPTINFDGGSGTFDTHLAGRMVVATGMFKNSALSYFPFDSALNIAMLADSLGNYQFSAIAKSVTSYGLPFLPTLLTVRPEARGGMTMQGLMKRWSDLYMRFYETLTCSVNGQLVNFFNQLGMLPSTPAASLEPSGIYTQPGITDTMSNEQAPLTLDARLHQLGYDRDGRILVQQLNPLPLTLLAMYGTLYIGDQ